MASDLSAVLRKRDGRDVPVVLTESSGAGVEMLSLAIDDHRAWLKGNRPQTLSHASRRRYHLQALIHRQVQETLKCSQPCGRTETTMGGDHDDQYP